MCKISIAIMYNKRKFKSLYFLFGILVSLAIPQDSYGFNLVEFSKKPPSEQEILYKKIEALQSAGKYDSASIYINKSKKIVSPTERAYTSLLLYRLNNFYHLGQFDSLKIVLPDFERRIDFYHYQYGFALLYRAMVLSGDSKYSEAIEVILEAIEEFEDDEDTGSLAIAYNSLGHYFSYLKDYEKAFDAYSTAANLNKSIGNDMQLVKVYNNMGVLFSGQNKLDSALYYYDLSSVILEKKKNYFLLAQNTLNRGNILEKKGDYSGALKRFEECLEISKREGFQYGLLLSKLNIGNLARITKDFQKADQMLTIALDMSKQLKLKREESLVLQRLSWLSRDQNKFDEAYRFGEQFHALNDSLFNEKVRKEASELLTKYESEKKSNEILVLNAEKRDFKYYLAISIASILSLLVLVLTIEFRRRKAALVNQLIEKEKKDLISVISLKDQELSMQAAQVLQIQGEIQRSKDRFWELLQQEIPNLDPTKKTRIHAQIQYNEVGAGLLEDFEKRLTSSNEDFFKILLEHYPDLKPGELKLCAYLRLNLSTKEISEILNKSVRTIETIRLSIRKKMNLSSTENLVAHLIKVEKGF